MRPAAELSKCEFRIVPQHSYAGHRPEECGLTRRSPRVSTVVLEPACARREGMGDRKRCGETPRGPQTGGVSPHRFSLWAAWCGRHANAAGGVPTSMPGRLRSQPVARVRNSGGMGAGHT